MNWSHKSCLPRCVIANRVVSLTPSNRYSSLAGFRFPFLFAKLVAERVLAKNADAAVVLQSPILHTFPPTYNHHSRASFFLSLSAPLVPPMLAQRLQESRSKNDWSCRAATWLSVTQSGRQGVGSERLTEQRKPCLMRGQLHTAWTAIG